MKQKYITRNYFFFIYIYIYILRNSIFFSCNKSAFTLDLRQSQSANYSMVDVMEFCLIGFLDQFVFLSMHACFSWRERERERERDRDSQTESFPLRHDSLNEFLRTKMFFEFDFCTGRTLTWDTRCFARCTLCLVFEKWSKLGM